MIRLLVLSLVLIGVLSSPARQGRLPLPFIAGGDYANLNQFPYLLNLQYNGRHRCGAVLIESNIAITAAHCVFKEDASSYITIAGTIHKTQDSEDLASPVERIEVHPKYDDLSLEFDIAILFLAKKFPLSKRIAPVQLPKANEVIPENAIATTAGWGYEDLVKKSEFLKFINTPIWSKSDCYKVLNRYQTFDGPAYCSGVEGGSNNACVGDSGGSLVYKNKLFGIVSLGEYCGSTPSIYTNVAAVRDWIATVAKI